MGPFLRLYGVLSRAAHKTVDDGNEDALASVNAFLNEIEENQDVIFPPTFQRTMVSDGFFCQKWFSILVPCADITVFYSSHSTSGAKIRGSPRRSRSLAT